MIAVRAKFARVHVAVADHTGYAMPSFHECGKSYETPQTLQATATTFSPPPSSVGRPRNTFRRRQGTIPVLFERSGNRLLLLSRTGRYVPHARTLPIQGLLPPYARTPTICKNSHPVQGLPPYARNLTLCKNPPPVSRCKAPYTRTRTEFPPKPPSSCGQVSVPQARPSRRTFVRSDYLFVAECVVYSTLHPCSRLCAYVLRCFDARAPHAPAAFSRRHNSAPPLCALTGKLQKQELS